MGKKKKYTFVNAGLLAYGPTLKAQAGPKKKRLSEEDI